MASIALSQNLCKATSKKVNIEIWLTSALMIAVDCILNTSAPFFNPISDLAFGVILIVSSLKKCGTIMIHKSLFYS